MNWCLNPFPSFLPCLHHAHTILIPPPPPSPSFLVCIMHTQLIPPPPPPLLSLSASCTHRRELVMLVLSHPVSHSVASQTNSSPRGLHAAVSVSTRCGTLEISPNHSQLRTLTRGLVSCSRSGMRELKWCTLLARYVWNLHTYDTC